MKALFYFVSGAGVTGIVYNWDASVAFAAMLFAYFGG